MMLIQVLAIATICYSSLFLGNLLAKIAKEELPLGKYYFKKMQLILKILIPLSLFIQGGLADSILMRIFLIIFSVAGPIILYIAITVFLEKTKRMNLNYQYALFGVILGIATIEIHQLALTGSLIFLYGLPTGTMLKKNEIKKTILPGVILLITTLLFS
ncbi:MAG: hypothetical protein O2779_04475 [Nanoarchaeota archaeon]|nr:hypothetical protein [Nanoarchaeota archaeon]